jgi:dihydroneopterin aldolase/2-amino-4-hydroxy-6-hydroxymethyldihydropteridine diphosphokinase
VVGIEVWAHHGVFDHERRDGQPFLIDVEWRSDWAAAAATDDLSQTIDYGAVAADVVEFVQGAPVNLIETLAHHRQAALLVRFPCAGLRVAVHNPQAPLSVTAADVVVTTPWLAPAVAPRTIVFSIGSNIEPCQDYLQFAVSALVATPGVTKVRASALFRTVAQGPPQPDFLNAVVVAQSALPARDLLRRGLAIEAAAHRTRQVDHGPRTLDIDLVQVGDEVWTEPELTIPHPRAAVRAFVLRPWLTLDPAACLGGQAVTDLAAAVADQRVSQVPGRLFTP